MSEEEKHAFEQLALEGFCHYCIMVVLGNLKELETKTAKEFIDLVNEMAERVNEKPGLPSIDLAYEVCGYPRKTIWPDEELPILPF